MSGRFPADIEGSPAIMSPTGSPATVSNLPDIPAQRTGTTVWDGIEGLRILEVAQSSIVEGQPLLKLSSTRGRSRHRLGLKFRDLTAGQVYRVTAWVKIDADMRLMLDVRARDPSSQRAASFAARRSAARGTDANRGASGAPESSDGWLHISADIRSMDGVIVAYVALADSENAEILEIEDEVELTFGGIRIVPFPDAPSATPSAPGIQRHPALPTFFVHIGLPNTATTTIQGFFGANRTALLEQGILYPESGAIHDSHSLVHRPLGAVLDPDSEPWLAPMASRFRERDVLSRLRGEVTATNALKIVLSSEDLTFMRGPALLKQALEPYQVRILVTIRRQDSFLDSFYNQIVKSRLYTKTFDDFLANEASEPSKPEAYCPDLAISNYHVLLSNWATVFGKENILVSVYEDFATPSGILEDMAVKIGFDIAPLARQARSENLRLSHSLVALKRRVNANLSGDKARVVAERFFSAAPNSRPALAVAGAADLARRRELMSRFQESNAMVARNYFADRPQLFPPPSEHDAALSDSGEHSWQGDGSEAAAYLIAALIQQWPAPAK